MSDRLNVLAAMCRQEENAYAVRDCLHQQQQQEIEISINGPLNITSIHCAPSQQAMENRSKMVSWCYRVVDFCKFRRETVAIAINIVDRYMMSQEHHHDYSGGSEDTQASRRSYQLAVMTALYTAVKIHEPEAMDTAMVATLSRGAYSVPEIEAMELHLLQRVAWRVNPPTAMAFSRISIEWIEEACCSMTVLPTPWSEQVRKTLLDLVQVQVELAVAEHEFLAIKASVLAYCALVNAFMGIGLWHERTVYVMAINLAKALQIADPISSFYLLKVQSWLYEHAFGQQQGVGGGGGGFFATTTARMNFTTASSSKPVASVLQRQEPTDASPRSVVAARVDHRCHPTVRRC